MELGINDTLHKETDMPEPNTFVVSLFIFTHFFILFQCVQI